VPLTLPPGRGIHAASMSKRKKTKRLILWLAGRIGASPAILTVLLPSFTQLVRIPITGLRSGMARR